MCFSVRRASSCNTRQPSSNGCSASSSCCFTGHLPSSSPACREIPWRCWLEAGPWDLVGENTRWTHWEGPVHTHTHIHTSLKACPYCSLLTQPWCLTVGLLIPLKFWLSNEFNYSFPDTVVWSFEMKQASAVAVHGRVDSAIFNPSSCRSAATVESPACILRTWDLSVFKELICNLHIAQVWNQILSRPQISGGVFCQSDQEDVLFPSLNPLTCLNKWLISTSGVWRNAFVVHKGAKAAGQPWWQYYSSETEREKQRGKYDVWKYVTMGARSDLRLVFPQEGRWMQ